MTQLFGYTVQAQAEDFSYEDCIQGRKITLAERYEPLGMLAWSDKRNRRRMTYQTM